MIIRSLVLMLLALSFNVVFAQESDESAVIVDESTPSTTTTDSDDEGIYDISE